MSVKTSYFSLAFRWELGEDKDGPQEEELGSGQDLRIGLILFSHPASWTSPRNRIVEWKAKNLGTEPYSSWWCSEIRKTNAKACIFGKAHWSVETFHREKLSLRWIALWFRKIYCQSSLSRGRRSFVPKEGLVHSIHLCGWRSSRGNEWLWRRVPFPTNCGSSWWLRIEINVSPGNKED